MRKESDEFVRIRWIPDKDFVRRGFFLVEDITGTEPSLPARDIRRARQPADEMELRIKKLTERES